jgi:hypothetical protein
MRALLRAGEFSEVRGYTLLAIAGTVLVAATPRYGMWSTRHE